MSAAFPLAVQFPNGDNIFEPGLTKAEYAMIQFAAAQIASRPRSLTSDDLSVIAERARLMAEELRL